MKQLEHESHGEHFAAVLALSMLGYGNYLHRPLQAQSGLACPDFGRYDKLAKHVDVLCGSVLTEDGKAFRNRAIYDAAGLALER